MVRLVQLLCPERHCLIAAVYDDQHATSKISRKAIDERMRALGTRPYCGLCGSSVLSFEDVPTKFASVSKAMPILLEAEKDNLATRALLRATGEAYDVKIQN